MGRQAAATRPVFCYNCSRRFNAAAQAMTLTCPHCYQHLRLGDMIIDAAQSVSKLQTCGRLVISARARVNARLVQASEGIEIHGRLTTTEAKTPGHFYLGAGAVFAGNCRAGSLLIERGAGVENGWFEVVPTEAVEPMEQEQSADAGVSGASNRRNTPTPTRAPAPAPRGRSRLMSLLASAING